MHKYSTDHVWLALEEGADAQVGISHHAQDVLGDLVFVGLPTVGQHFAAGDAVCLVESVKAASDVIMPVAGTVTAVNPAAADAPELVNEDPENAGWLFRIQPDHLDDLAGLLDAAAYQKHVG